MDDSSSGSTAGRGPSSPQEGKRARRGNRSRMPPRRRSKAAAAAAAGGGDATSPGESTSNILSKLSAKKEQWAEMPLKAKGKLLDEVMLLLRMNAEEYLQASLVKRGFSSPEAVEAAGTVFRETLEGMDELPDTFGTYDFNGWQEDSRSVRSSSGSNSESDRSGGFYDEGPSEVRRRDLTSYATAWLAGISQSTALLAFWLRILKELYEYGERHGTPPQASKRDIIENWDGTWRIRVGPNSLVQKLMLSFGSLELYVARDGLNQQLPNSHPPSLVAVLGAGNYDGPIDVLHSMFIKNAVCVYKLSSLSYGLEPILRKVFKPLISQGFLSIVTDETSGSQLVDSPLVDHWCLTGAHETAKLILEPSAGPEPTPYPASQKERTLELGNCTPWIVCPGDWSQSALERHAMLIVDGMLWNGGHACIHPQIIVTSANWPLREVFMDILRRCIRNACFTGSFYAATGRRIEYLREKLTREASRSGGSVFACHVCSDSADAAMAYLKHRQTGAVDQWTSDEDHEPSPNYVVFAEKIPHDSILLRQEAFCTVTGEVCLDVPEDASMDQFLSAAVDFVNESCVGTLACSISIQSGFENEEALDKAICNLKYGSIGINLDPKVGFSFPFLYWGAFHDSKPHDDKTKVPYSGQGYFGNCFGYEKPLKSVCRAPFLNATQLLMVQPSPLGSMRVFRTLAKLVNALCPLDSGWVGFIADWSSLSSAMLYNY